MDIYEATQAVLADATAPDANVTYIQLAYDEQTDSYIIPDYPAVTWLYSNLVPVVTHTGGSGLYRVLLDVEIWGSLDDVALYEKMITDVLNAKRVKVENVIFTVIIMESRDIVDLGIDCKHRFIRFNGMVEVREEEQKNDSR